jgi:hypothetical protein
MYSMLKPSARHNWQVIAEIHPSFSVSRNRVFQTLKLPYFSLFNHVTIAEKPLEQEVEHSTMKNIVNTLTKQESSAYNARNEAKP